VIPLLGVPNRNTEYGRQKTIVSSDNFNTPKLEVTQMSTIEWISKLWYVYKIQYYNHKNEQVTTIRYKMENSLKLW
jgi:hypothetical protein